jgi:predicted transcriptional regulator
MTIKAEIMERIFITPGHIHGVEVMALEPGIRRVILGTIGLELRRLEEIGKQLDLGDEALREHLTVLERALLVEQEGEGYRLTPRCIAYLDQVGGYEWRR